MRGGEGTDTVKGGMTGGRKEGRGAALHPHTIAYHSPLTNH